MNLLKVLTSQSNFFNESLTAMLEDILTAVNAYLKNDFKANFQVSIQNKDEYLKNYFEDSKTQMLLSKELYLDIEYFGKKLEGKSYQSFLNEARLSALAICIYLAALKKDRPTDDNYKILFLDDIFIGLDMSNRLPLIEILNRDFTDYQIFMTTYDRAWFEVAKRELSSWATIEMYIDKSIEFEKPLFITPSKNYFEKANDYFVAKDYAASANYLRKEIEKLVKERLPEEKTRTYGGKPHALSHLWELFCERYSALNTPIDSSIKKTLETTKLVLLNPQSHDGLSYPIYERELVTAFELVEKIRAIPIINHILLLNKGSRLKFTHPSKNYTFEFELLSDWKIENLDDKTTINDPRCKVIHSQYENKPFWNFQKNEEMTTDAINKLKERDDKFSKIIDNLEKILILGINKNMILKNTLINKRWRLKDMWYKYKVNSLFEQHLRT